MKTQLWNFYLNVKYKKRTIYLKLFSGWEKSIASHQRVAQTGVERHESALEYIGLWRRQGSANTAASHLEAGRADVQQRRRGLRRHLPDQRGGAEQRLVPLCAAGHLQVDMQNRHHVVPVRRSTLRDEVRQLDLWWISGLIQSQGNQGVPPTLVVLMLELNEINYILLFYELSLVWFIAKILLNATMMEVEIYIYIILPSPHCN